MCGILGIGGTDGRDLAASLIGRLRHRGPDDQGLYHDARLALGHRRLSIIGLEPEGAQPRTSRSGRSVIVFNGEIYNFLELADELEAAGRTVDRRFDTDVLLEALEHWGTAAIERFDGMFAFAWYRPAEARVLLVRDRWGKKPLFWGKRRQADGGHALVFASELRIFAALPGGPPPPDPLGVVRYLVYDGMPDRRTVYQGVEKVPAATWIEVDTEGGVRAEARYWRLARRVRRGTTEEAVASLEARLTRALALRLRSDVPVGLFLSGGIDSSLLAAAWRRAEPSGALRTFTVGFDEASYDERAPARTMAEAVGAEHHEIRIAGADLERELDAVWNHLSEPFSDPSILPMSALCRAARGEVTVALGGDGADELQAGYDPFRAWGTAKAMSGLLGRRLSLALCRAAELALPVQDRNMSARFKLKHFAQGFRHPEAERIQGWMAGFPLVQALAVVDPDLGAAVDPEEVLEPTRAAFEEARPHGALVAQMHAWIKTYLECSILTKVDRAGMMHSLEVRAPFLDPDLATFLLDLPETSIFRHGRGKVLLRELARRWLPPSLVSRPKKGLGVPQAAWLRGVLRPRMEACLEANRRGGWFRQAAVEALWDDHLRRRDDHRRALWTFLFAFPFQRP